jgi:hypothetical protein
MARQDKYKKRPSQRPEGTGRERRIEMNDIRHIAVHEAGHAVAAIVQGVALNSVDIEEKRTPDGMWSRGFTDSPIAFQDTSEATVMPFIIQSLCGPLAEMRVDPNGKEKAVLTTAFQGDYSVCNQLAAIVVHEDTSGEKGDLVIHSDDVRRNRDRAQEVVERAVPLASALVDANWNAIDAVATRLLEAKFLTGSEVSAIVAANPPK